MATSVAVIGDGDSNRRNTNALLSDFVEGFAAEVTFVVPVTAPWFSDAVRHMADWLFEHQSTFVNITFVADSHDLVDLADYEGIPITEVGDMLAVLAQSDQVIVSWSDSTDWLENWVEGVLKAGHTVLDLTDGLYPIEYTPDDEADVAVVVDDTPEPVVEPEPVEEPPAEKPKPRSRAARNAAKAQEKSEPEPESAPVADDSSAAEKGPWPPAAGTALNTPEFYELLMAEVERRVVERLRSALA